MKRKITREDIMMPEEYAPKRRQIKQDLLTLKKPRRVEIGPVATCYFESFETMRHQINEMLFIEKGGEDQIQDELSAYGPLVPNGQELTATVMFEIDDPLRRKNFLSRLGGVEETMFLRFGDHEIIANAEEDVDRTTADGKASSVQFLHFPFNKAQIADFKSGKFDVILGFGHPNYAHMTILTKATIASLSQDLDD